MLCLLAGEARADRAIERDCLDADPRYSVEACAAVLADASKLSPDEIFELNAAAGNAELARGKIDYALLDFSAAVDMVELKGASPGDVKYADVLALKAMAEIRDNDPEAALKTLLEVAVEDVRNPRIPFLTAYAHFAAGDAKAAVADLEEMAAAHPNDQGLAAIRSMFTHWQIDPAAAAAECQKYYAGAECGAGALAKGENDKAAADLASSILAAILAGDVPRMSREKAPGAWSDCEAQEPQYAIPGCDQILAGDITPEERYAATVSAMVAAVHNDAAGEAVEDGQRLIGKLDYGAAKAPDNDPAGVRAHALVVQGLLAQGWIDEAGEAVDAALADQPDDPTYLVLRALVDLAQGSSSDALANMDLAEQSLGTQEPPEVAVLMEVINAVNDDMADGIAKCQRAYDGAGCGSAEYAADDNDAAFRAMATDINAVFVGDAERPFTLVGVDQLP